MKEAIALLEKAKEHLERFFGGSSSHCHEYLSQALSILQQPKAQPMEFTALVRQNFPKNSYSLKQSQVDWLYNQLKKALNVIDTLQPKAQSTEFVKECREYINGSPGMSKTTCKGYAERLKEALKIIDEFEAE